MPEQRRKQTIPFNRIRDVQENEPKADRKCLSCSGHGIITIFSDTTGKALTSAICPTCGGTRYEP